MICHRCCSGIEFHDGIPMYGSPLRSIQASSPSFAWRIRALRRLGRGGGWVRPLASFPWHLAQLAAKSALPAASACALCAKGLARARSSSGTRRSHLPSNCPEEPICPAAPKIHAKVSSINTIEAAIRDFQFILRPSSSEDTAPHPGRFRSFLRPEIRPSPSSAKLVVP